MGVIKDPEENLSIEAVDNASIDSYATNALLNDEELKIVSLLERIQEKFVTLDEGEKVEFVRKISDYQDRFTSTLDKVEEIPGMYNLDVAMLRTNLGIPGPSDTLEEIHDPRDYEEVKVPDATVEIAPDIEATVSYDAEAESLVRAAAEPTISVSMEPERSLDDIYEVLTQLVQLVIYQISEEFNKPEPALPDYYYYPTPSVYMRSSSPFSRVRANKRKNSRKVRPRARPSPTPVYGRQVPYNQDLAGILNSIPPVYDIEAEIIARQVAQEYAVWYDRTYLPWYNAMMGELEERRSYTPWFLNLGDDDDEEDDESEELMSEEHNEAVEQMALYKALLQNVVGDDDEDQASEGGDQSNEGEGDDQAILDSFNHAMQQLQENYLAMLQTGEDEE